MSSSPAIGQLSPFFKKGPLLSLIFTVYKPESLHSFLLGCSLSRVPSPAIYNFKGPCPFLAFRFPRVSKTLWSDQERVGFFPGGAVTRAKSRKCEHMLCLQNCKMTGLTGVWTAGEWGMRIQEPSVITSMKLLCKLPRLFWGLSEITPVKPLCTLEER